MKFETLIYEVADDHTATITLHRPERLNAFNDEMCEEFVEVWNRIRLDDAVHAVVLQGDGDRGFNTGVDTSEDVLVTSNPLSEPDPGRFLGPKSNQVWKPVICALHGLVAGGAFYWINESDIVICSEEATFFDPHLAYGWASVCEPVGLAQRVNLGDVLRMTLLGLDERMSAERALTIGLVTEVVAPDALRTRAHELAATIAAKPPAAVQSSVRGIWESLALHRSTAIERSHGFAMWGNALQRELGGAVPGKPATYRVR